MMRKAVICICDPKTMLPEEVDGFDMESTLIHELLHVKFCMVTDFSEDKESLLDELHHQIIQDCARAIILVKRSTTNDKRKAD